MEAACRGAAQTGGGRIGVVLAGRGPGNAAVAETIVARDLGERLRLLRDLSDAWVFFPRGLGTMLELVWIAESVVKSEAPARPLLIVGEFWRAALDLALREAAVRGTARELEAAIHVVSGPEEATAIIFG